jgi:6-phosphofructokinase 1
VPLKSVAGKTKTMPRSFINRAGNNVTQAFIDYAAPLVGELPKMERLI